MLASIKSRELQSALMAFSRILMLIALVFSSLKSEEITLTREKIKAEKGKKERKVGGVHTHEPSPIWIPTTTALRMLSICVAKMSLLYIPWKARREKIAKPNEMKNNQQNEAEKQ
jgi:uncharacterized membrane protein YdfJ with MMPL/SSD domain